MAFKSKFEEAAEKVGAIDNLHQYNKYMIQGTAAFNDLDKMNELYQDYDIFVDNPRIVKAKDASGNEIKDFSVMQKILDQLAKDSMIPAHDDYPEHVGIKLKTRDNSKVIVGDINNKYNPMPLNKLIERWHEKYNIPADQAIHLVNGSPITVVMQVAHVTYNKSKMWTIYLNGMLIDFDKPNINNKPDDWLGNGEGVNFMADDQAPTTDETPTTSDAPATPATSEAETVSRDVDISDDDMPF